MASLRQLGRSLFARLVARVLIAALLLSLVPLSAEASIPQAPPPDRRLIEDIAFAPAGETACLVVLAVADPIWLTKTAFGELLAHTGTDPQPYAFAGEPLDPNVGFQYHRARWMDPRVGRFVGMDPFGGSAFDPPSLHRYTYVHNDPPNGVDSTGLVGDFSIAGLSIAIGVSATIHGISAYQQDGSWYGVAAAVFEGAFEGAVFYTLFATGAVVVSAAGRLLRFLPALWNAGKVYPRGFTSFAQFRSFGRALQQGLSRGGHPEAKAAFQGSSVTGRSFGTGQPFDVGRISDFDIALGSPQLLARARAAGVALRSAGTRTGPLTEYELQQLGLAELRAELSRQAGREVNFMIFESIEAAVARGASMGVSF